MTENTFDQSKLIFKIFKCFVTRLLAQKKHEAYSEVKLTGIASLFSPSADSSLLSLSWRSQCPVTGCHLLSSLWRCRLSKMHLQASYSARAAQNDYSPDDTRSIKQVRRIQEKNLNLVSWDSKIERFTVTAKVKVGVAATEPA